MLVGQTCSIPTPTELPTILIIDDNPDSALLATYVLEDLGYHCLGAATAAQGLTLAVVHIPDLILLDIVLPDYSGVDVLNYLHQCPQTATVPVIAVTALARGIDRLRLMTLGCVGYISKPYLIDELEAIVQQQLSAPALPQKSAMLQTP